MTASTETEQWKRTEKSKATLLQFASSEITAHASNLIGMSIILFTYMTAILTSNRFPQIELNLQTAVSLKSIIDYKVIFIIFWVINSAIIFAVMRLVYYGRYTNQIIEFSENVNGITDLRNQVRENVRKERFLIPLRWFENGVSKASIGLSFSFCLGFLISAVLFFVFFFK